MGRFLFFSNFFFGISMNIYVGNLSYSLEEDDIRDVFAEYGSVESVKLIMDRATGRKRGFGFVEMNDADGENAIENLNGKEVSGRTLVVNQAKEREQRSGGFNRDRAPRF